MTELEQFKLALETLFKEHIHDGHDTKKIGSGSISVNSFGLKNIRAVSLTDAIKVIDELIGQKQNTLRGTKGYFVIYDNNGQMSEIDPNFFSKASHSHGNYIEYENIKPNNIPLVKDKKVIDSNIDITELASNHDIKELTNKLEELTSLTQLLQHHGHT